MADNGRIFCGCVVVGLRKKIYTDLFWCWVLSMGFDCGCSLLLGGRFCDGRMVFYDELRFWWPKFFRDFGYEFLRMKVNFGCDLRVLSDVL